jgi:hypothetical protein
VHLCASVTNKEKSFHSTVFEKRNSFIQRALRPSSIGSSP